MTTSDWQSLASSTISKRDAQIPTAYRLPTDLVLPLNVSRLAFELPILTEEEKEIIALDGVDLHLAVKEMKWSCVQVTTAYAKSASIAQQTTNCLTELFIDEAMERAKWLDGEYERTGEVVGPLHGVVISIKDQINIKGHPTNAGFLEWAGKLIAETDAHIIQIFRAAGAIFMTHTTLPQAIMHLETSSYLGPTLNPHNTKLTSGGSSGGEGAIVAMHGSGMGIGTDIGGSIRNPAGNCGIYGFKPTSVRLPKLGLKSTMVGTEAMISAIGPMTRSCRDLEYFIEVIYAALPWKVDPTIPAIPWVRLDSTGWPEGRARVPGPTFGWAGQTGKLRIGIWKDDGVCMPVKPVRRAMDMVVEKLEKDGRFELVEYTSFKQQEGWELTKSLYFMDGGANIKNLVKATGEPLLPLTEWIIGTSRERTIHELWEHTARRDAFRLAYLAHFHSHNIDVILSPYGPCPAPPLGTARYWSYTSIFNLVDYPAAVFPTGVKVQEDDVEEPRTFRNAADEENARHYDPKTSIDAPVCLQLAAPRWEDERLMAALKEVDEVVNGVKL